MGKKRIIWGFFCIFVQKRKMKQMRLWMMTAILTSGLVLSSCSDDDFPDVIPDVPLKSIVILYENDVHCAIDGYTKFVGLRDAIESADTSYVGMVSCGDFLQGAVTGAISRGQYIVDIMKEVGYDAITIGNHEFDYGVPRMQELLPQINCPVVVTNLFEYGKDTPMYPGYVIQQYGNKKVAFVGTTTPESMRSESYAFFDRDGRQLYDLRTKEVYSLVQQATDKARSEGADYVVVLSHLSEMETLSGINSHALVATTTGIDVVLDGHSHSTIPCELVANKDGKMIPVTQTGTQFANVGKLWISKDGTFHTSLIADADNPYTSSSIDAAIEHVNAQMSELTSRQVATLAFDMPAIDAEGRWLVRMQEAPIGNLVADAFREYMLADIGLVNGGGVRNNLSAGIVTYGHVVSVQPYDNHMCKIEATGAEIMGMLQKCTAACPGQSGQFPQISGMKFTIHTGSHTLSDVQVYDRQAKEYKPLNLQQTYTISLTDYYSTGGFLNTLKECRLVESSTGLSRDALADYLEKTLGGIIPDSYQAPEGRITIVE